VDQVTGFPKPQPRVKDRVAYKIEQSKLGTAFRQAVWKRDESRCQRCNRLCRRTMELVPERGEVDHKRGRNVAPEDRYNVSAAQLLCHSCHRAKHGQR
jgi:5-methylcytosine-specific restriction endonuclease McrA